MKNSRMARAAVILLSFLWALPALGENLSRDVVLTGRDAETVFEQCSRATVDKIEGYWIPSKADIQALEKGLPGLFKRKPFRDIREIPAFDRYVFQYSGYLKAGRKMIYINAIPLSFLEPGHTSYDWHKDAVRICDGGPSLFGVIYDVQRRQFIDPHFNGAI